MTFVMVGIAALVIVVLVWSLRRDPRWTGNAFLLTVALLAVLGAIPFLSAQTHSPLGTLLFMAVGLVVVLSPLLVLALVVFLLLNGVQMMRKEGRSLGNLLSLLAGLGIVAVLVLLVANVLTIDYTYWLLPVTMLLLMACGWAGFLFVSYLLYTLLYPRVAPWQRARYVMVHGSGLIRDRVPPLLRARVDRGIGLWRQLEAAAPGAVLIVSGGKGSDEMRSEASAMAEYALTQGVPQEAIMLEDQSATTEANLRNTRELVAERMLAGVSGVTVTSSYHVLRTAALARAVGIDAQVQGAPTAGYFWPSAFLREVVALVMRHRLLHVAVAALVCLPLPLLLAAVVIHG